LTPYHVTLFLDNVQILILPPCSGPSMITTPTAEFRIKAIANVLTTQGQKQFILKLIPSLGDKGWDVVPDDDERVPGAAN
jgi:hypothetical protein